MPRGKAEDRESGVDALRGLAAVAVVVAHITQRTPVLAQSAFGRLELGKFGVIAFFVISGFVLPLSLDRGGYRWRDWARFLAKRAIRLEPPYLVSLLLTVALGAFLGWDTAVGVRDAAGNRQLLLHLGYLVPFSGSTHWLNAVYWTLAIEFQFYLVLAVAAPLVLGRAVTVAVYWFVLFAISYAGPHVAVSETLFPAWASVFALGVWTYYARRSVVSLPAAMLGLLGLGVVVARQHGTDVAMVAFATATFIASGKRVTNRGAAFLGSISYSLYLVHWPIVVHVENAILTTNSALSTQCAAAFLAAATSMTAAYLLFSFVERRSKYVAKSVRYSPHEGDEAPALTVPS